MKTFTLYANSAVSRLYRNYFFSTLAPMLSTFISTRIRQEFGFEPTEQQSVLIDRLGEFIMSPHSEKAFLLKGYAGTGKTTVVSALVRALNGLE